MRLTQEHYDRIAHCFPKHRGSLTYSNLEVLNAILYIAENGAKWRRLPKEYGHWHTVYARMRGWARQGVLARVFEAMQAMQIIAIKVEVCSLDSTSVKVHPDGTGALKKTGRSPSDARAEDSQPRFTWLPQMSGRPFASHSRQDRPLTARRDASSWNHGKTPSLRSSRPS
jgi:transposase